MQCTISSPRPLFPKLKCLTDLLLCETDKNVTFAGHPIFILLSFTVITYWPQNKIWHIWTYIHWHFCHKNIIPQPETVVSNESYVFHDIDEVVQTHFWKYSSHVVRLYTLKTFQYSIKHNLNGILNSHTFWFVAQCFFVVEILFTNG